jgi:hypothetical protein
LPKENNRRNRKYGSNYESFKTRGASITDTQTAGFTANIDISEPTFVTVEVLSPFNNKQAQAKVSTELWVIPGKDILGDGIILKFRDTLLIY